MSNIRNDIPFPGHSRRNGRPPKYPWKAMKPGDSFAVHIHDLSKVRASAHAYNRRHGSNFAVEKMPNGDYRCWCLPDGV